MAARDGKSRGLPGILSRAGTFAAEANIARQTAEGSVVVLPSPEGTPRPGT